MHVPFMMELRVGKCVTDVVTASHRWQREETKAGIDPRGGGPPVQSGQSNGLFASLRVNDGTV